MDENMKTIGLIKILALFVAGAFATQTQAVTFNFNCITSNGIGTCDTAEAQMILDVTASSTDQVLFEFSNNDVGAGTDYDAIIGEVYFYDGLYLDISPTIINGTDVNFVNGATPGMLPGYNYTPLSVFAAADVDQNTADGVAVGDGTLGILFTLLPGADFDTVITAMNSGELVVGIHAKALDGSNDISESLVTVPVPAAAWLLGSGLIGLIGLARRKKA